MYKDLFPCKTSGFALTRIELIGPQSLNHISHLISANVPDFLLLLFVLHFMSAVMKLDCFKKN